MRLITRYLLQELLKVFMVTFVSMTLFIFLVLIVKQAVEEGLGLAPILRILPYMLPQAMQYTIPGSMLMAATSVYGRVAGSNELIAAKALGISPLKFIWPVLCMAVVASFAAVKTIDLAVSWGREGTSRVVIESLEEIAYGRLRTTRQFRRDNFEINVRLVDGKRLIGPTIQIHQSNGPTKTTMADEGEFSVDIENDTVSFTGWNVEGEFGDDWQVDLPGRFTQSFPISQFTGVDRASKSPSDHALSEIGPAKDHQVVQIEQFQEEFAAVTSYALLSGNFENLTARQTGRNKHRVADAERRLNRFNLEPYRRWSTGFSCLCFALIGAPMAIRRRHGEFWGSFFACFLPILLIYYPMLMWSVGEAKSGDVPPVVVWVGNVVLALWGVWLIRRVIRF
ncbi:MAG: LptF/LptG family permease [Lacipirellulaceae bacterium]